MQETEVIVTRAAQCFQWKGYGLKLVIPSQSLPVHISVCTLTITMSISGQYQLPDGTELVSPVFWLRCEPKFTEFIKPLSLEIQHCALPENSHRLFMARAACTQKDLPYTFKLLHGGTFNKHSSYGVIGLHSFSGVGVAQERSEERRYWSSVFYMGPPHNTNIHFTVTWHSDAHITVRYHHTKKSVHDTYCRLSRTTTRKERHRLVLSSPSSSKMMSLNWTSPRKG